ncbi:MAG: hypothetical protein ACE14V_12685 [bacterium]
MNDIPRISQEFPPESKKTIPVIKARQLLFETIREYRNHFGKYFAISAIVLLPLAGFTAWFNPESRVWYLSIPFSVIATLISYYSHIALLYITREYSANNPTKISTAYLTSVTMYLAFVYTMILVFLATLVGTAFCVIPGIMAYVVFCIADGIVVWEGTYSIPAMQRSLALIRNYFWQVLWILVVFDLSIGLVTLVLTEIPTFFLPEIPNLYKQLFNKDAVQFIYPWWYVLYQELINMIIFPTGAIMTYILYRNLKEVNEQKIELPLNL